MAKAAESPRLIAENRKARFDYFIEERFEAGLALQGWEVKAMRAGRAQLKEAYVYLRGGEAFLIGAHLAPLPTTSTPGATRADGCTKARAPLSASQRALAAR